MPKYKFLIQSSIGVVVEADNEIEARMDIIDNLDRYADDIVKDPYVSDGEECKYFEVEIQKW